MLHFVSPCTAFIFSFLMCHFWCFCLHVAFFVRLVTLCVLFSFLVFLCIILLLLVSLFIFCLLCLLMQCWYFLVCWHLCKILILPFCLFLHHLCPCNFLMQILAVIQHSAITRHFCLVCTDFLFNLMSLLVPPEYTFL